MHNDVLNYMVGRQLEKKGVVSGVICLFESSF